MARETRRLQACRLVIDQGLSPEEAARTMGIKRKSLSEHLRIAANLGEIVQTGPKEYRWARTSKPQPRRPKTSVSDALLRRGTCPACGSKRAEHRLEWVEVNGHPRHYIEDCLRRQLQRMKEQQTEQQVVGS